jgi:ferredoxin
MRPGDAGAGQEAATKALQEARHVASVDGEACTLCGACEPVCPTEAITLGESVAEVNAAACSGCGACVDVCPNEAIKLIPRP